MARLIAVVLLLTLVVAPASAEPQGRGELPLAGWFDAIWDVLDRIFSWVPTIRSEPRKHGAYIVPSGIQAAPQAHGAYIVPSGVQPPPPNGIRAAPRKHGAYIVPSGVRADPAFVESRRMRGRTAIERR